MLALIYSNDNNNTNIIPQIYKQKDIQKVLMLTHLTKFTYMFLCGLFDSLSTYWIRKILFVVRPQTRQTHPSSFTLLKTFKNAFIQVILLFICLPAILDYLDFDRTATVFQIFFLLLCYGYLFFYNIQAMTATKQIALWSANFPNTYFCQFDVQEKFNKYYAISNLIKGLIFLLLYYTPLNLILVVVSLFYPTFGSILMVISQAFFSSTFYFLEKWPYDQYNIAFIQKNVAYMLGFGFFVSFVCNWCLEGFYGIAAFFIISLWMMINCQLYSPPPVDQFQSFSQVWETAKSQQKRARLPNAFNLHRSQLRKNKQYRKSLKNIPKIVKPALFLTQYINDKLGKRLQRKFRLGSKEQPKQKEDDPIIIVQER